MSNKQISVLVADPDKEFYENLVKEDSSLSKIHFDIVTDGAQAQSFIKENFDKYKLLMISPEIERPNSLTVISTAKRVLPTVPLYVTSTMKQQMDSRVEDEKAGITGRLAKPMQAKDIVKILGPMLDHFDSEEVLKLTAKYGDKVNEELTQLDEGFSPIKAELFVSGSKSLFDVYVRLKENKYVKILQAGDNFDYDRLLTYLKKDIAYFWIRNEAQEAYINYCNKLTKAVVDSPAISLDKKFGFLFNQCEITLNTIVDLGVDCESIAYAQKFTCQVFHMVNSLSEKNNVLAGLLKELGNFEHSASVVIISSLLAKASGIETEKSLQTLGLAAMLHDVGLYCEQDENGIKESKENKKFMDEECILERLNSKKVFGDEKVRLERILEQHAFNGASLVSAIEGINPSVPQIIQQHHYFEEKAKFGQAKSSGPIHPMSEFVAISDSFVKILKKFQGEKLEPGTLKDVLNKNFAIFPGKIRRLFSEVFPLI